MLLCEVSNASFVLSNCDSLALPVQLFFVPSSVPKFRNYAFYPIFRVITEKKSLVYKHQNFGFFLTLLNFSSKPATKSIVNGGAKFGLTAIAHICLYVFSLNLKFCS